MKKTALLLILALNVAVLANDRSLSGVGGSLVATGGEHPGVQMLREQVTLEVYPRLIFATADFTFRNHGAATKVTMGFPESGWGDIDPHDFGNKPGFLAFETWVDGEKVQARREIVQLTKDQTYEAHWVKEVPFQAGQQRKVRVRYVAPVGTVAGGEHEASYTFSGGNWQGKVEESKLEVFIHPIGFKLLETLPGLKSDGKRLSWVQTDWEAEQVAGLVYTPTRAGILPESSARDVTEADLKGRSARELTLMRNEIFARYGRPFKDAELRKHFEAQSWYRAFEGYQDSMLSVMERENAERIAAYQSKHGLSW